VARILVIAAGSLGDVAPYLGLAKGLGAAGHRVTIASHGRFEALVRGAGVDFALIDGDPRSIVRSPAGERWIASGRSVVRSAVALSEVFAPIIERSFEQCLDASAGADALLPSRLAMHAAHLVAAKRRIPIIPALLQPAAPTSAFPSVYSPMGYSLPGPVNFATHLIAEQILWLAFRASAQNIARRHGLPAQGLVVSREILRGPSLLGVSAAIIDPRSYPPGGAVVTGYWFPPSRPDWRPSEPLAAFLAAGPAPVCMGFGSMRLPGDQARIAGLCAALRRTGARVLVLGGWSDTLADDLPDGCFFAQEAPHDWLFPRVAGVIHHGGAGTTAAALRAARPSLITPFFADQFFWARRLHTLGLGPRPGRLDADPDATAASVCALIADPELARRLGNVGARIAAENGPEQAAHLVGQALDAHA
jgi:sterol 3beta-glucosyltransferase